LGELDLNEKKEKITLPDELQKEMFKFFLKTSIPRKKKELEEKANLLSENQKTDRSADNGKSDNENGDLC
jgi:hypothetical protein